MSLNKLKTPAMVLDQVAFENNIKTYQEKAANYSKEFWPMTKTPKSTWFMKKQKELGASGVLCGTLDECEKAFDVGFKSVMYAYPVSDPESIKRVIDLSRKGNFYLRLDSVESFKLLEEEMDERDTLNYLLIINVGLNRFGVEPKDAGAFLEKVKNFKKLTFKGIATHPGHVDGGSSHEDVLRVSIEEEKALRDAKRNIEEKGFKVKMVSTGSTPTFTKEVEMDLVTHVHPGNYVFHDAIQLGLGACKEKDVSLYVLASIISHPREGVYLIDAGAKCLGLDKGAHGNTSITGFGRIKDHPEAEVLSVSEEVGVIHAPEGSLEVGERIFILPNHSCSVANLTNFIYLFKGDEVLEEIEVDIRGNSYSKK